MQRREVVGGEVAPGPGMSRAVTILPNEGVAGSVATNILCDSRENPLINANAPKMKIVQGTQV